MKYKTDKHISARLYDADLSNAALAWHLFVTLLAVGRCRLTLSNPS